MEARHILITAAVGLACFVLGLLVRGRRRDDGRMIVRRSSFNSAAAAPAGESDDADAGVNLQLGRDVEELLSAGKKIQAVVLVRERTGMGLKESKDVVDRLEGLMKRLGN